MSQTRLDRLLVILDTGSTPVTRKAAGTQLGEVQKLHPHELPNLLSRVHVYLKSKSWDTRVAAAHAIECIASNVPQWNPDGVKVKDEFSNGCIKSEWQSTFVKLDIRTVLERGEKLLGSAGDEFEHDAASTGLTSQESVSRQHMLLRKQIGGGLDVGVDDLLDDDDLILHNVTETLPKEDSIESAEEVVMSQIDAISSDGQLSSREKNRAKRRMKMMAKQKSKDKEREKMKSKSNSFDCGADVRPPPEKIQRRHNSVLVKQKSEHGSADEKPIIPHQQTVLVKQPSDDDKIVLDSVTDNTMAFTEMVDWPFESFCSDLCDDLFSPVWEIRHGAASALREIIKLHGSGAGKSRETPVAKMDEANIEWLEVMSWKLLCIFALDQFTDFVTDEVVAPVRETTAQTLGAVLHHLNNDSITRILHVLIQLQEHDQWQVRHGGLLGLKYMLAISVQKKMVDELLPQALPWVMKGLQDVDDDIRGLAAASLLPVSEVLGQEYQKESLQILNNLWDILHEPDDLTASTNSVMSLLSSLITVQIKTSESMLCCVNFGDLVPRLWPFFKHNITSVRMSSLKTMKVLLEISQDTTWMEHRLSDHLQQVFQRIILEQMGNIREMACEVWSLMVSHAKLETLQQIVPHHSTVWFRLLIQPHERPFDPSLLTYTAMNGGGLGTNHVNSHPTISGGGSPAYYISSINFSMDASEKDSAVIETRLAGSNAIGKVFTRLSVTAANSSALSFLLSSIETLLSSQSALKIIIAAMVVQEWAKSTEVSSKISDTILLKLQTLLSNQMVYEEVLHNYQRLQIDTQSLICAFQEHGIDLTEGILPGSYNLETSADIANTKFNEFLSHLPKKAVQGAQAKQKTLLSTISVMQREYTKLNTRVLSSIAGTLISLNKLTPKLSPIVQPLMGSVKKEEDILMRNRNAMALAQLMMLCVGRTPSPNNKIIKNLSSLVCCDKKQTPTLEIHSPEANIKHEEKEMPKCTTREGILTLQKKLEAASHTDSKKSQLARSASVQKQSSVDLEVDETSARLLQVQRQGAAIALSTCVEIMGVELQNLLPSFWGITYDVLKQNISSDIDKESTKFTNEQLEVLITAMQVLEVTGTSFHTHTKDKLLEILPYLISALSYPYTSVRHMASRCIGIFSKILTTQTMDLVLSKLIDVLGESDNLIGRQGSIETLVHIIDSLGLGILPYLVLLIVPILGRMSDQSQDVRLMATNCFAGLVQLMPLESGVSDPPGMSMELTEKKASQRHFLEQLMNPTKLDMFNIPIPIDCTLRKYQQDGVNWLAFLNKYNLHGILCDDMGLGKTLQSICIVAGDHYNLMKKYKISGKTEFKPLPSLIVCPPTLTGHWCYEVKKFCKVDHLNPLHYMGPPADRQKLQPLLCDHNIIVASYDIIRNDSEFFLSKHWNYCILDEGHIIKNSKTKLAKVIKMLNANHRLILSGTPIQNNVLELWSLFDFLMPGFLGSEKEFTAKFGKPILQSRDAKSSSKEQEAGALAMERLHKQTLPFLLRRVKEDVLQDLPPKIIQDYYCELSPLQMELYEDFSRTQAKKNIEMDVTSEDVNNLQKKQVSTHIFQALQYLRKVCNHPCLVLTRNHPEYESVITKLQMQKSSLQDIQHSGKLVALKQLLLDCGIGATENASTEDTLSSVVSQHRALIFCQLKSMIDIIENDLFKTHMPSVTYSKLDGSIPAGQRQGVVQKFNNDPSIDVLLLTTHVGGLGLNLTGADTVIFVEHDWNPMKDLQAMDRAHRIGQKKVVNVYKLIARGTLEEKIMGLQKFKMNIANTVISQDNSSLQSMDTSQVLDLFTVDSTTRGDDHKKRMADSGKKSVSIKEIVEEAGELWDEKQYENEYNLDTFMESLAAEKN